jgi:hypothetical protein
MATVHYYTKDSVAAQLLYALQTAQDSLAHQAASELYESEANETLFRVLSLAWWLQSPDHPLQYARTAAFLAQDCHALLSSLLSSPFSIPDIEVHKHIPASLSEIKKYIKKRQLMKLFQVALGLTHDELISIGIHKSFLSEIQATSYKPLESRILFHACGALLAYESVAALAPPFVKEGFGKKGRTFTILEEACSMWQVKRLSANHLRGDPHKHLPLPEFQTMDQEIEFYNIHFPDDIPDEWSDSEISKSHAVENLAVGSFKNPWRVAFLDCL